MALTGSLKTVHRILTGDISAEYLLGLEPRRTEKNIKPDFNTDPQNSFTAPIKATNSDTQGFTPLDSEHRREEDDRDQLQEKIQPKPKHSSYECVGVDFNFNPDSGIMPSSFSANYLDQSQSAIKPSFLSPTSITSISITNSVGSATPTVSVVDASFKRLSTSNSLSSETPGSKFTRLLLDSSSDDTLWQMDSAFLPDAILNGTTADSEESVESDPDVLANDFLIYIYEQMERILNACVQNGQNSRTNTPTILPQKAITPPVTKSGPTSKSQRPPTSHKTHSSKPPRRVQLFSPTARPAESASPTNRSDFAPLGSSTPASKSKSFCLGDFVTLRITPDSERRDKRSKRTPRKQTCASITFSEEPSAKPSRRITPTHVPGKFQPSAHSPSA